jgi:ribonuclease BN (tRNA processing enzyme)
MIAECSHPDGWIGRTHLTPSALAALASEAEVGTLVPVHAYPGLDPESLPDLLAQAGYPGRVVPGRDGLCIVLEENATKVLDSRTF